MTPRFTRLAAVAAALTLIPAATASAASIWTPLSSGTTANITAIATPSSSEILYTTDAGQIFYFNGSGFSQATFSSAPSFGLTSIGMSQDGTHGVAVGQHGEIYYTTDSGVQWTKSAAVTEYDGPCSDETGGTATLTDELYSARFVPGTATPYTVYVTGADGDVLRSTNSGQSFTEVNKNGNTCIADPGQEFTDSYWLSSTEGYLISDDFGEIWLTTDGFTGTPSGTTEVNGGAVNGYTAPDHIAVDTSDHSDLWAQGPGATDLGASTDGGNTWNYVNFESTPGSGNLTDVASSGTTVVTVGQTGEVWTSPDGVNFYDDIPAQYPTENWNAVALVPGTNTAVIGGNGGALAITGYANALPPSSPPTGTISGPTTLTPGEYGTYTLNASDYAGGPGLDTASYAWSIPGQSAQKGGTAKFAFSAAGTYTVTASFSDDLGNTGTASITIKVKAASSAPSGSGQHSTTTGGATVGVYKKVTLHGKGRYIPVNLSDKKKRRFVIELLTNKKHSRLLSRMSVSLDGKATVHLGLGKNVGSGTYVLEVKIYTTGKHAKQVGKRIKQVFILN